MFLVMLVSVVVVFVSSPKSLPTGRVRRLVRAEPTAAASLSPSLLSPKTANSQRIGAVAAGEGVDTTNVLVESQSGVQEKKKTSRGQKKGLVMVRILPEEGENRV